MYAELERICRTCRKAKPKDEFKRMSRGKKTTQPDCRDCRNEKEHERGMQRNYGINAARYNLLFQSQGGKCAICERHQSEFVRRLAVDHDHETDAVRSLLCIHCNQAIGHMNDNPELLMKAARYIKKFKK